MQGEPGGERGPSDHNVIPTPSEGKKEEGWVETSKIAMRFKEHSARPLGSP